MTPCPGPPPHSPEQGILRKRIIDMQHIKWFLDFEEECNAESFQTPNP